MPCICLWTSVSAPIEPSSLDFCRPPSCSQRRTLCDLATTATLPLLLCKSFLSSSVIFLSLTQFASLPLQTQRRSPACPCPSSKSIISSVRIWMTKSLASGMEMSSGRHHVWLKHRAFLRHHASRSLRFALSSALRRFCLNPHCDCSVCISTGGCGCCLSFLWPAVDVAVLWFVVAAFFWWSRS